MSSKKLIRDKIAEIMKSKDGSYRLLIVKNGEYYTMLKIKLLEEVNEFIASDNVEELIDILEVIEAIAKFRGYDIQRLFMLKEGKRMMKGGFDKGYVVEFSE